ncbi:Aldehyde reductase 2 [Lecanosticta acicola]|uniref:Aldehyde reductase 2 n=1 Tax=Lecanosticta acicola TaxID=111012 RepID=A0AAI9EFX9_9PEZI|nr:Aldehyde reductase 2 [Lecanosticta acicola]
MQAISNLAAKLIGDKIHDVSLSHGSLILVTGASGYIGSHVVNEALAAGFRVRGTARTHAKAEHTKKIFGHNPNYSTAIAADFSHEGAFDEAVQEVDAVIHVASDTTFDPDPNKVVKPTVAGVLSILRSAAKTPSVKQFVLTSSSSAALLPHPNKEMTITADHWDQEALDLAWAPPPYNSDRAFPVYAASKTEAEKAFWKFVKDEKPHFVANAVLPNYNMGRILEHGSPGATGEGVRRVYRGEVPTTTPQYMIDVVDDARLHLIAAFDPSINNERIFAFNVPFNWTDIIHAIKQLRPNANTLPSPPENEGRDLSKVPNQLGAELLKKWYGQETGYKPLTQSIEENLEGIA